VKLVADFESSDLTQREFANERGVSFSGVKQPVPGEASPGALRMIQKRFTA
jgi:hypothetical protein